MDYVNAGVLAWVSYVSTPEHLQNAVQGVFDSRPLVYYGTATILMLYLARERSRKPTAEKLILS